MLQITMENEKTKKLYSVSREAHKYGSGTRLNLEKKHWSRCNCHKISKKLKKKSEKAQPKIEEIWKPEDST